MDIERITLAPRTIVGVRERGVRPEGMREFFGRAMEGAYQALLKTGLQPAGPPLAVYQGDPEHGFDVTAGFPVVGRVAASDGVEVMELPTGPAVAVVHVGSYDTMTTTYAAIESWMKEQQVTPREPMWEEYLSDPSASPDPATWRTRIVFPVVA